MSEHDKPLGFCEAPGHSFKGTPHLKDHHCKNWRMPTAAASPDVSRVNQQFGHPPNASNVLVPGAIPCTTGTMLAPSVQGEKCPTCGSAKKEFLEWNCSSAEQMYGKPDPWHSAPAPSSGQSEKCGNEFMLRDGYFCQLQKGHSGDHEAQCPNPQFHQRWANWPDVAQSEPARDERVEFEKAYGKLFDRKVGADEWRPEEGKYFLRMIQSCWEIWQAARAASPQRDERVEHYPIANRDHSDTWITCSCGVGGFGDDGKDWMEHARAASPQGEGAKEHDLRNCPAMRALEHLTPGGSEYIDDIPRCVEHARHARESLWKALRMEKALENMVEYRIDHLSPHCFGCDECRQTARTREEILHREFCRIGMAESALRKDSE